MTTLYYVTENLSYLAPRLLVYLVGVILSLVNLNRCAKPAAFALVSCSLLLLIAVAFAFIQGYIITSSDDGMGKDVRQWMNIVAIVRSVLDGIAYSLLLAAVFVGRSSSSGCAYR